MNIHTKFRFFYAFCFGVSSPCLADSDRRTGRTRNAPCYDGRVKTNAGKNFNASDKNDHEFYSTESSKFEMQFLQPWHFIFDKFLLFIRDFCNRLQINKYFVVCSFVNK